MKIRKYFCWLLGHRYKAIWFKPAYPRISDAYAGVADTEAGCVYCGQTSPNEFFMNILEIDWEKTTHRQSPPIHRTYNPYEIEVEK